MDKRTFWSSKRRDPEFHGVVFEHPAFDAPIRLVANVFDYVTLGGYVHKPAPMSITMPQQKGDAQPKLSMTFPRVVVGREFKRQLARVSGSRYPIVVTHSRYLADTSSASATWRLYVSDANGVAFSNEGVTVTATLDNPMRRSVAPVYEPDVFTGLEDIS